MGKVFVLNLVRGGVSFDWKQKVPVRFLRVKSYRRASTPTPFLPKSKKKYQNLEITTLFKSFQSLITMPLRVATVSPWCKDVSSESCLLLEYESFFIEKTVSLILDIPKNLENY